jgi:hypothetical protein
MKTSFLIWAAVTMFATGAYAGITYSATSGTIPDGSAVGWAATATGVDLRSSVSAVSVNLNISGGYNGDLYAYLSYGGALVPLLNRVGVHTGDAFGYATAGMNVTLADGGTDIHTVLSPTSGGSFAPDGRAISPQSGPSSFDASGTIGFSAFNDKNPNGTWTLFIADMSAGAQSQLVSWSLDITAVPEPVNVALGVFAGLFAVVGLARSKGLRKLLRQTPA